MYADDIEVGHSYILGKTPETQETITIKRIFNSYGDKVIEYTCSSDNELHYLSFFQFRTYAVKEVSDESD